MKQLPQPDPRGILALEDLSQEDQAAEDSRAIADADIFTARRSREPITAYKFRMVRSRQDGRKLDAFGRPATPTERKLLTALGYDLPEHLVTAVHFRTSATRFRWWPQLEEENN